jgi:hypothetical protein
MKAFYKPSYYIISAANEIRMIIGALAAVKCLLSLIPGMKCLEL